MLAFAEKVFASETKGEGVRDEISMFEVQDDCPILQQEMAHHLHTDEDTDKRKKRQQKCRIMTLPSSMSNQARKVLAPVAEVLLDTPTYLEVPDFQRVAIIGDYASGVTMDDFELSCKGVYRALTIREKYMRLAYQRFPLTTSQYLREIEGEPFKPEHTTYTHRRLKFLMSKFNVHEMLNEMEELKELKLNPHRDFYNCRK
ncbi:unnamed protein product, partial [Coregonus sp. 'balchen']